MLNWLIFCSFIASLSLTLLGLIVDISYQVEYVPKVESLNKNQRNVLAAYLADKEYFTGHELFNPKKSGDKDLKDFFNRIMESEPGPLVSEKHKKTVLSYGDQWVEKRNLVSPNRRIDQLFSQVHNFDSWSLDPQQVADQRLSASDFIVSAQIYLSNSLHFSGDDVLISLEQTRHLSRLLLSTEVLNFKLAGLSILEKEQQLIAFMNRRKLQGVRTWASLPSHDIKRYRDHLRTTASFLNHLTPEPILTQVFLGETAPIGLCAIYNQKNKLLSLTREFLEPKFPMEPDFSSTLAVMTEIQDRVSTNCMATSPNLQVQYPVIRNLPFYRRLFALNILLKKSNSL